MYNFIRVYAGPSEKKIAYIKMYNKYFIEVDAQRLGFLHIQINHEYNGLVTRADTILG
jgi:hypothetical protein